MSPSPSEPRSQRTARSILITLGRLPKGLELARAFAGVGCRVVMAEPSRWHMSRLSRSVRRCYPVTAPNDDAEAYIGDLLKVVEREGIDLVVPVSEETLHAAALRDRLPPRTRIFTPPLDALLELHDKYRFIRLAERLGLPVPETEPGGSEAAADLARRRAHVVKPMLSSSGQGVQLRGAAEPGEIGASDIVQAFLPGPELSTFSICDRGRLLGTVVYRGLIMSTTVAVCFERLTEPPRDVLDWVAAFAAGTAHSGFLSFDFRLDEDGVARAIECNPRATSGMHFVAPDDLARAVLEPETLTQFRFRDALRLQQFYPALTVTQAEGLAGGRAWRANLRHLFGCRDVSWSPRDPLPFLLMPLASWPILQRTMFLGETFGEASTYDIGWYADPQADASGG